jgi:hypothetical protein
MGNMPEAILKEVEPFRTLETVLNWGLAKKPPASLVNVVTQDEFTHDVIFKIGEEIFLVFDTT